MNIGSKINFEYEEVLDRKTQGLIRVACSVALSCPTLLRNAFAVAKDAGATAAELKEATAYAIMVSAGRARNFAMGFAEELGLE